MKNFGVAFTLLPSGEKSPPANTRSSSHLVVNIIMELIHRARWVKYVHINPDPKISGYADVVLRESIRIFMTYATLIGLDVMAAYIKNA